MGSLVQQLGFEWVALRLVAPGVVAPSLQHVVPVEASSALGAAVHRPSLSNTMKGLRIMGLCAALAWRAWSRLLMSMRSQ